MWIITNETKCYIHTGFAKLGKLREKNNTKQMCGNVTLFDTVWRSMNMENVTGEGVLVPFSHNTENEMVGWVPLPAIPMMCAVRYKPAAPCVLSTAVWYTPLTSDPSAFRRIVEPSSLRQTPVILQKLTFGDQTFILIRLHAWQNHDTDLSSRYCENQTGYLHMQRRGLICRHHSRGNQSCKKQIPH